jgi:outer membrane lipoprotein SlyB
MLTYSYPAQRLALAISVSGVLLLSGCQAVAPRGASDPVVNRPASTSANDRNCVNCATVESIRTVRHEGQPTLLGTIGGAVVGGVLGNQVGGGVGRSIATGAGAVGGAAAGREVERRLTGRNVWEVVLKYPNGTTRTVTFENDPQLRTGEVVSIN